MRNYFAALIIVVVLAGPQASAEESAAQQTTEPAANEAYEALKDPAKRRAYDQLRASGYRPGDEFHPPPHFGDGATLGGCVATGLSGPRRPYSGAVRDFVLGVRVLDGKGEDLRFGGKVMKNVAGFDVSRLMTGAMGTLGILLEVSLKCLPKPKAETPARAHEGTASSVADICRRR